MNQSLKIDPYGFREYDARWLYEKDINANDGELASIYVDHYLKKDLPEYKRGFLL